MNIKNLRIFSQNIWKNSSLVNIILRIQSEFDIIFIQELSWITICSISSSKSKDGEELVGIPNHPNWITFSRASMIENNFPYVVSYINIRISSMQFSLHKDILNHKDISLTSFFNNNNIFSLINIYSDSSQAALKYLKNMEATMIGNFNIHNNLWDPNYLFHSSHSDLLFNITDSLNLGLLHPINLVPTKYSDNKHDSKLVINLMFLRYSSEKTNNHSIWLDWRLVSDHTPLIICIPIFEEFIQTKKYFLVKNSDEEKSFISNLIDTSNLQDIALLENIICTFALATNSLWNHYSKTVNITKHSKSWWDMNCSKDLDKYRISKIRDNLRIWLREWNKTSSISKSKKLPIKKVVHGILWNRSTSKSYLLLRQSSTITNCALKLKIYGALSTQPSTRCRINKSTSNS